MLDWGLGHATRSVPLIEELIAQGAEVVLAGSDHSGRMLRRRFPDLIYLELPGYRIHYHGRHLYWSMLRQLPKIVRVMVTEYRWLKKAVRLYSLDGIISDSRFGCFHSHLPSVFLAHQLRILLPSRWLSVPVNSLYRWIVRHFGEVWVPDTSSPNLSGRLAHPSPFLNTRYLGLLSRLRRAHSPVKYDLLILLSGPEPQRTVLETIIRQQIGKLPAARILLVQGLPNGLDREAPDDAGNSIQEVAFLDEEELAVALAAAKVVVCRSGYSTLMDLATLQKKAILIPTPRQPEQEYLARRCAALGWAVGASQDQLDLAAAWKMVGATSGIGAPAEEKESLSNVIRHWLATV